MNYNVNDLKVINDNIPNIPNNSEAFAIDYKIA